LIGAGQSADDEARRHRRLADEHRRKAAYHEQAADRLEKGTNGERATAWALHAMEPDGWYRFDDIRWSGPARANIDHVVVGPGGVFVIDSKNWRGKPAVRDGVLRVDGDRREREVASAADAALAVSERLPAAMRSNVTGILCLVRDEPIRLQARDVLVCSTSTLPELLRTRPRVFDDGAVAWAYHELAQALTPASSASAPRVANAMIEQTKKPDRSRSSTRPRRGAARSQNRRSEGRRLVIGLGIVAAIVAGIATGAVQEFSEWLGSQLANEFAEAQHPQP
jgi:hypothetical protein